MIFSNSVKREVKRGVRRKERPQVRKWVFAMHRRREGERRTGHGGAETGISGDKTKRFPSRNCSNFDSSTSMVEQLIAMLLLPLYEGDIILFL